MESVLVIRFSSLGDVVLSSAVVEAVLDALPDCRITILTKSVYAPVFASDRRVARIIGIEGNETPAEIAKRTGGRFDAVIDLHGSLRSVLVGAFIRARVKARVNKHSFARRLMIWSRNRFRRRFDVLGSFLETLRPLGIESRSFPRVLPGAAALDKADVLLSSLRTSSARLIGLAPGSRHPTKRWGALSWARLAEKLEMRGGIPIFIGDAGDASFVEEVRSLTSVNSLSLAGSSDLAATIGIIARLDSLVCNDSGIMHLAGALGVPFAAVFGPTHPDLGFTPGYRYGAVLHAGLPCSPCSLHGGAPCRLGDHRCMEAITPDAVLDELDRTVRLKGSRGTR
jgi:heptosyltransferase-2